MKRKLSIAGAVFSGVMLAFVFLFWITKEMDEKILRTNFWLYTIIFVFCSYRLYRGEDYFAEQKRLKKEQKLMDRENRQRAKDQVELDKLNRKLDAGVAIADFKAQIIYGLPVPEGAVFNFRMDSDGVLIKINENTKFFIPSNRVIGANSVVKKDVVQVVKSSYGKAAFGGLLFGDAGAIIGGMPESKFKDKYTSLYIFAYKTKEGTDSTLLFMADDEWEADRFVKHMRLLKPVAEEDKVIEL